MPFCVAGGCQLCFGRGEQLEAVPPTPQPLAVLLVKDPTVSVSTPWAYKRCRELNQSHYLADEAAFEQRRQALRSVDWLQPLRSELPPPLRNDLQEVVAPETAAVRSALDLLNSVPESLAVAMSGSGPSCFALFSDLASCRQAQDQLTPQLDRAGLKAWSCALRSDGVRIEA